MSNRQNTVEKGQHRRSLRTCVTHVSDDLDQSAVAITITDPLALIALARTDPVTAAREAQAAMTTLQTGFNEHKVGLIGAAYAAAYHMMRNDRAWERFLKDPGWGGLTGKPKNTLRSRNRMLHHVMRYMFRAESKVARARVRVYANMLIDRFYKSFSPEGVVPLINRRGIENLRKAGEAQRKAERQGADPFFADLNEEEAHDAKPAFRSANSGVAQRKAGHRATNASFDDLDEMDANDAEPVSRSAATEEVEYTQAQVERFTRALATFSAGLMSDWLSHMKRD